MNREIQICNKNYFFISKNSFSQHPIIRKEIRLYINNIIYYYLQNNDNLSTNIVCIGGESYLFGMSNKFSKLIHYTNSKYIYNDVIMNNYRYKKKLENHYINYNVFNQIKNSDFLIINLAKLHINILKQCNKRFYKFILIINCHHNEFWNRISLLNNYKLVSRKQFIVTNYFVTVTLFQYTKNIPLYISLGNTCAIAYQLKNVGLRNQSYPFDWCKISIKQLNYVLEEDFKNYSNLTIYKFSDKHQMLEHSTGSYLLKNSYNILFAHELYKLSSYNLISLKEKINKRIQNFKSSEYKYIRFIIQKEVIIHSQINILIRNLKSIFTNFIIIYITNINQDLTNINIDQNIIKIITVDYNIIDWSDWKYSTINWFDLLFSSF